MHGDEGMNVELQGHAYIKDVSSELCSKNEPVGDCVCRDRERPAPKLPSWVEVRTRKRLVQHSSFRHQVAS